MLRIGACGAVQQPARGLGLKRFSSVAEVESQRHAFFFFWRERERGGKGEREQDKDKTEAEGQINTDIRERGKNGAEPRNKCKEAV